jgi:hypothetical protein
MEVKFENKPGHVVETEDPVADRILRKSDMVKFGYNIVEEGGGFDVIPGCLMGKGRLDFQIEVPGSVLLIILMVLKSFQGLRIEMQGLVGSPALESLIPCLNQVLIHFFSDFRLAVMHGQHTIERMDVAGKHFFNGFRNLQMELLPCALHHES